MLAKGFGGAERAFVDTALALASRGHDVQAICQVCFSKKALLENVPHLHLETIRTGGELDFFVSRRIASLIRAFDSDVVHSQLRRAAWHGGRAAHLAGVPLVSKLHNYVDLKRYKYVHTLIATTKDQRRHALDKGWPADRVQVIPNFSRVVPVDAVRDFSVKPLRILSYGRLVKKKGFDILLRAFRLLLDSGVDARLTIGGKGVEQNALRRLAVKLGVQDRVDLGVWIDDVQTALDAADVFVLPSLDEPFGIVMLEAMARGLPVVTTRTQGPSQVFSDQTAWFAEVGSVESLAGAFLQAIRDPSASRVKAQAALDVYRTLYYEETVLPRVEALYRSVRSS